MTITKLFYSSTLVLFNLCSFAQTTPEALGFKAFSITNKQLGTVNYYISSNKMNEVKPVLLYLDGSGPYPLFMQMKEKLSGTIPFDYKALSEKYHIILISKPGTPFVDSVKKDAATGIPKYNGSSEYKQKLSLMWRVDAANLVLNEALKKIPVNKNKIAVMGGSEGFQVGADLVSKNRKITHALLFVGNGLNQLYDFIIQNRMEAQSGKISQEEAQKNIDSLYVVYKDIYANPTATDKEWLGHTYLRWASFSQNIPLDDLLSTNIPVYIIAGSNDTNTTALSTDYIFLESIRKGKNHITYKVYPYDHFFNETVQDEQGNVSKKSHYREVISEALNWLNKM